MHRDVRERTSLYMDNLSVFAGPSLTLCIVVICDFSLVGIAVAIIPAGRPVGEESMNTHRIVLVVILMCALCSAAAANEFMKCSSERYLTRTSLAPSPETRQLSRLSNDHSPKKSSRNGN